MEAKGQETIKTSSEIHFFLLIEKRMAQQGFEILETLDPDRNSMTHKKEMFAHRPGSLSY